MLVCLSRVCLGVGSFVSGRILVLGIRGAPGVGMLVGFVGGNLLAFIECAAVSTSPKIFSKKSWDGGVCGSYRSVESRSF